MRKLIVIVTFGIFCFWQTDGHLLEADLVVAPNQYANVEGGEATVGPTRGQFAITYQWVIAESEFASIPQGAKIDAIGFRLNAGRDDSPAGDRTFDRWDLQVSQSLSAPGSLNPTFDDNIASDVVLVKSGRLDIADGSFVGGPGPNPFFLIEFDTPYEFVGGDLLFTIRHSGLDAGQPQYLSMVSHPIRLATLKAASATMRQFRIHPTQHTRCHN